MLPRCGLGGRLPRKSQSCCSVMTITLVGILDDDPRWGGVYAASVGSHVGGVCPRDVTCSMKVGENLYGSDFSCFPRIN
jgi:hypothetical protein